MLLIRAFSPNIQAAVIARAAQPCLSAGAGKQHYSVRILNRPEIVVVTLKADWMSTLPAACIDIQVPITETYSRFSFRVRIWFIRTKCTTAIRTATAASMPKSEFSWAGVCAADCNRDSNRLLPSSSIRIASIIW